MNKIKKVTVISSVVNLVSGIVVFVMIVTLFFSFYINFKNKKKSVLDNNKIIVESIEASLLNSLLVNDAVEINRLMGGVVGLSKVGINVYIIDHNGKAVYAWPDKQLEYQLVDLKKVISISASFDHTNTNDFIVSEAKDSLVAQKILKVADTPYYWRLITVYSLSSFKKEVFLRISIYVLAFLIISYITYALSNLLLRRKLYPLSDIIEQISAISNGQYDLDEIPESHASNFRELISGFNKMKKSIKDYHKNAHLIAIGSSTAMVAHDVRRPMASMKALLGSLLHIKDDPRLLKKMIADVDRNITNTNAMLNDIMEFSHDDIKLELNRHNIESMITSALGEVLRKHEGADVKIEYDFGHQQWPAYCDGARVARVLGNIVDNAFDAMKDKTSGKPIGVLTFKTYAVNKAGKRYVGVKIIDSGPGIPETAIPKLFDAFFTQGKKGGTGLGLSICKKIIEKHDGWIEARNRAVSGERGAGSNPPNPPLEKGGERGFDVRGAEFIIELPADEGMTTLNLSELIHHSGELNIFRQEEEVREEYGDTANVQEFMRINKERGRRSTMLIVDDEPLFRETIRSVLSGIKDVHEHVKVVEVDSAETGLKLFEACEFDYVIADIDLGRRQMNGYEFTRRIMQKYPQTYVLIHSNKRKSEMDEEIRSVARSASRDAGIEARGAFRETRTDTRIEKRETFPSGHFMGFLPKPMTASELLQFLACKSFETDGVAAAERKPHNVAQVDNPPNPSLEKGGLKGAKQVGEGLCPLPNAHNKGDHRGSPLRTQSNHLAIEPTHKKTVLLVNDDETFSFNMKYVLKAQGLQVLTATNVSDALQHLTEQKFDAIFSDINLEHPTENGYEFLAEVRKKDAEIPFIFMSGYNRAKEWPKAEKAGATDYLQLPFEMEELMGKLGV